MDRYIAKAIRYIAKAIRYIDLRSIRYMRRAAILTGRIRYVCCANVCCADVCCANVTRKQACLIFAPHAPVFIGLCAVLRRFAPPAPIFYRFVRGFSLFAGLALGAGLLSSVLNHFFALGLFGATHARQVCP